MASTNLTRKLAQLQQSTVTQSLTAFTNMFELKLTHAQLLKSNNLTPNLTSRLLTFAAISNSGDLNYAKALFDITKHPTLFMYNTMIRGFSQSTQPIQSIQYYIQMLEHSVSPDYITFPFLIKSCSLSELYFLGEQVHSHVLRYGFCLDVFVLNNLIGMYCNFKELGNARRLFEQCFCVVDIVSWTTLITGYSSSGDVGLARMFFDEMPCRNVVSWNAMVTAYACSGRTSEAKELFDEMPERNGASWSAMISGYLKCGMGDEALGLFGYMVGLGVVPNEAALVSAVSACAQLRALEKGEWMHRFIEEQGFEINVSLGTAIIDMYGKCGNIERAYSIFKKMPSKNVMTWNIMITGMLLNGCGQQALSLFWRMQEMGPSPNSITFISLLTGCSHSGMVDDGRKIFNIMTHVYQIEPQLEHYGCMVDLLGRAGHIKEALDFVESMPVEPHPGLWGALVGACKIHGETELGEEIGKHLIELEPQHSGRYALLSNLFASENRWDDVVMMRNLLKERKVIKNPGNSIVGTGIMAVG